jgi:hypothetical protein
MTGQTQRVFRTVDPVPIDLGQLLRLRGMITSSAAAVTNPNGDSAAALTQSYVRLRARVRELMTSSSATLSEFDAVFPEIEVIEMSSDTYPRQAALRSMQYAPQAKQAQVLLGQFAGWVTGLIDELEYEQRNPRD